MCGRYVLALRYQQIRSVLEENGIPIHDPPFSELGHENSDDDIPDCQGEAFTPTYNFAPGYQGIVLRATVDKDGAANHRECEHPSSPALDKLKGEEERVKNQSSKSNTRHLLQTMRWGYVPSWAGHRSDNTAGLKTFNCRSDTLSKGRGLWSSARRNKRCVIIAQGFFEWRKIGAKERVPHYIRRRDGQPLLFAGLWGSKILDKNPANGIRSKLYTYTIITTDSNDELRFLHDRMPVIFDFKSKALRTWLDPNRHEWSDELQNCLQPWFAETDGASLAIDIVSKDVNKVGHSSPSFIVPVSSPSNKATITNYFTAAVSDQVQQIPKGESNKVTNTGSSQHSASATRSMKRKAENPRFERAGTEDLSITKDKNILTPEKRTKIFASSLTPALLSSQGSTNISPNTGNRGKNDGGFKPRKGTSPQSPAALGRPSSGTITSFFWPTEGS